MNYHVVTVTEGGADFEDFDNLAKLISRFANDLSDTDIALLAKMQLGERRSLNGNSFVYALLKEKTR